MPEASVDIYDDYRERLMAPGEDVPRAFDHLAEKIHNHAQRNAPRRTGRLKEESGWSREGNEDWVVSFDAPYALYVEEGHRVKSGGAGRIGSGHTTDYVAPNPFLRTALDAEVAEFEL